ATAFAKAGQRVVVLDANFGLANLDVLLGLSPRYTLEQVLKGEKMIEEVLLEAPVAGGASIRVIPTSSGVHELSHLDPASELRLTQSLQRVCEDADWLFIDTAAGIHDAVLKMLAASQEVILVSTPEPTSLLDAYAMLKVLHLREPEKAVHLVINNAQNREEANEAADQLRAAARHFLGKDLGVLGLVPSDRHLLQAVRQQRSVVDLYPGSPAGVAIRAMAESLAERVGV
ncbi:MAG: hypothetical protein KGN80_06060, partial [Acidobacteriota bacterium]|nr:hypothetical protein [Acidobacteriota bacterium]